MSKRESCPEDVVYTPEWVAKDIVDFFRPEGVCLDPCRGDGAFFNLLGTEALYCEIAEGIDFFLFEEKVDWIVSNPPYSIFDEFLLHSYEVADEIVYLIPVNKVLSSIKKLRKLYAFGGIKHIRYYGSGRTIGFPFGFPVGAVHISKGYTGKMGISSYDGKIKGE